VSKPLDQFTQENVTQGQARAWLVEQYPRDVTLVQNGGDYTLAPLTKPGPPGAMPVNPVIAVPGLTPRFPSTTVGPLLVTVEPARTPNVSTVDPRVICAFRQRENIAQKRSTVGLFTAPPFIRSIYSQLADESL